MFGQSLHAGPGGGGGTHGDFGGFGDGAGGMGLPIPETHASPRCPFTVVLNMWHLLPPQNVQLLQASLLEQNPQHSAALCTVYDLITLSLLLKHVRFPRSAGAHPKPLCTAATCADTRAKTRSPRAAILFEEGCVLKRLIYVCSDE